MPDARGLGKGLDALIPKQLAGSTPTASQGQISQVPPASIDPNPHQPRRQFSSAALKELASSIKVHGILQPLVVVPKGSRYQLVAGERRLRAAKQLKLATVPVVIRSMQQQQQLELAVIENLQREDLNVIETAAAYRKLIDEFNLKDAQIAQRVGKDVSTVRNVLRLLNLSEPAKQALMGGKISEGHARAILAVAEPSRQQALLEAIVKENLNVRQAEQLARQEKLASPKPATKPSKVATSNPLAEALSKRLQTNVSIEPRAKGGRLVIAYKDDAELDRIAKRLS